MLDGQRLTAFVIRVEESLNRCGQNQRRRAGGACESGGASDAAPTRTAKQGELRDRGSLPPVLQRAPDAAPGLNAVRRNALEEALLKRRRADTAADYVLSMLPQRGYALEDGQPDCVRFYKQALIAPDVWSTFLSHTHAPSKVTLFRILFALRMNEDEARRLLSLAGSGFSATDLTDQLVLACLDCGFYDQAVVYDVFEFYREAYASRGKGVRNIYGGPH